MSDDVKDSASVNESCEGLLAPVGTEITKDMVPLDNPVVYLTRDVWDTGEPREVVDVWVGRPRRDKDKVHKGVVFCAREQGHYIGSFTDAAVRARFRLVPEADECLVFDNARVN